MAATRFAAGADAPAAPAAPPQVQLQYQKEVVRFLKRLKWQPKSSRDWDRLARIGPPALELVEDSLKAPDPDPKTRESFGLSAVECTLKIGRRAGTNDPIALAEVKRLLAEARDRPGASSLVITKAVEALDELDKLFGESGFGNALQGILREARTARADQLEGIAKSVGDLAQKYPRDADKAREAVVKALSERAVELAGKATAPELGTVAALVTQIQSQFKDVEGAAQVGKGVVKVLSGRATALAKAATPAELGELATFVENVQSQFKSVEGAAEVPKGVVKELSERAIRLAVKATKDDLGEVEALVKHVLLSQYKGVEGASEVPRSVVKALSDRAVDLALTAGMAEGFGTLPAFVAELQRRFQGIEGAAETLQRVGGAVLRRTVGEPK